MQKTIDTNTRILEEKTQTIANLHSMNDNLKREVEEELDILIFV